MPEKHVDSFDLLRRQKKQRQGERNPTETGENK
jgi:hypothetical protein